MLNKFIGCGRLTADPELRYTGLQTGTAVTQFSIAIEQDFKGQNGERGTDFINVVAWRGLAEHICKYFSKGKMIIVCGRLSVRKYTDKEGKTRYITEVVANDVYFAGDKQAANTAQNNAPQTADDKFEELLDDTDLPF